LHGGAVQVDPGLEAVDPTLAFRLSGRGFRLLKLKYEKLLSNFGFNCNLCPSKVAAVQLGLHRMLSEHSAAAHCGEAVHVDPALTPD